MITPERCPVHFVKQQFTSRSREEFTSRSREGTEAISTGVSGVTAVNRAVKRPLGDQPKGRWETGP